jgi:BMFP domain-containing protein YqiC
MTQSRPPEDRDLITRVARLEYRLTQIENTNTQLQQTIEPGGYVTDAFERIVDRIDGVEERLRFEIQTKQEELNTKIDGVEERLNAKLDILIRGMTGMGQE